MGTPVLIIGESGNGKSTSMRNLNPDDCILIQAVKKPLPFRNKWKAWDREKLTGSLIVTDKSADICRAISYFPTLGKKIIIIDDFQYTMANAFLRRSGEAGFTKFTEMAKDAWDIVMACLAAPDDVVIYVLSHSQTDERGMTRCKTIGKLLDEKITLEGLFTIVMRAVKRDGNYLFTTQNDGYDTIKTPMGMFDSETIDNDLLTVTQTIKSYYQEA
jgi:hypothetical protein